MQEHDRYSQALNEIDRRIHANLGFDAILQSALDGFVDALRADAGDIKLFDGAEWAVRYQVGFGSDVVDMRLDQNDAPVAEAVRVVGDPVAISDYFAQTEIAYVGFPLVHHLRASLALPLIARGDVFGCLFAWWREDSRQFSASEIDFARRIAASVALALENARLYEAEQEARKRAEESECRLSLELERTNLLLKASDQLSETSDLDELLHRLSSITLEVTGLERVFINLIDFPARVLIPKIASGGLVMPRGQLIHFSELSQTSRKAITEKRTAFLDYELPELPERDREIAQANQAVLVLFVPLIHQGELIGHISLDEAGHRCEFTAEQIRMVESIAAQAAVAIQNARRYEREHRIADTLQKALLATPPSIEGLEVSLLYQPASAAANVGGDFYDVYAIDDDLVALVVGDVAGKGIRAARLTALVRDGARAYLLQNSDPKECLSQLNELVYRFSSPETFATMFLGVMRLADGHLRYCNAGHPTPAVLADHHVRLLESTRCSVLGAFSDGHFETSTDQLELGDKLIVVTDGVTEARNGRRFLGEQGLADILPALGGTSVEAIPSAILSRVMKFSRAGLQDDVVIMCVSRTSDGQA